MEQSFRTTLSPNNNRATNCNNISIAYSSNEQ